MRNIQNALYTSTRFFVFLSLSLSLSLSPHNSARSQSIQTKRQHLSILSTPRSGKSVHHPHPTTWIFLFQERIKYACGDGCVRKNNLYVWFAYKSVLTTVLFFACWLQEIITEKETFTNISKILLFAREINCDRFKKKKKKEIALCRVSSRRMKNIARLWPSVRVKEYTTIIVWR